MEEERSQPARPDDDQAANNIKARDNYTCQRCVVALADEPHLLLEADHMIRVSRGGQSTPENLQTLG